MEKTVKCRFCGKLYKFMPFYVGDQSACPSCVRDAKDNMGGKYDRWIPEKGEYEKDKTTRKVKLCC